MSRARLTPVLAGAAVLAVAAFILLGGSDKYTVKAELQNASGLRPNASVKIAGVPGGKVKKVEVSDRDTAIATLEFKEEAAPIGRGSTIQVRPTDLLGERYADLDPGDVKDPLPDGGTIPLKNTSSPVELDDVLNMLDADTRTRLRILINEFGIGLGDRGKDFHQLLEEMPPALDKARGLLAEVASENVRLKSMIEQGDRITATINGKRDDLGELVDEASGMLRTVAKRRQDLGATVENAPGALGQLRSTLARLDSASEALRPMAGDLRSTAAPLASTLRALPGFADSAKGTLDKAEDVAPTLRRLGVQATPTVKRLRPTVGLLNDVGREAKPGLAQLDRRGMEDVLWFVHAWARAMKGRDALGHFIGAMAIANEQLFISAIDAYTGHLGAATSKQRKRGAKPALSLPKLPALEQAPKVKLPALPKVRLPKVDVPKITSRITEEVRELPGTLGRKLGDLAGGKSGSNPPAPRESSGSDAIRLFDYLFAS
jgi:virulence factor Mce-like protein